MDVCINALAMHFILKSWYVQLNNRHDSNLFPSTGFSYSKVQACMLVYWTRPNPTYSCSFHCTPVQETATHIATHDGESLALHTNTDLSFSGHERHGRIHAGETESETVTTETNSVWILPETKVLCQRELWRKKLWKQEERVVRDHLCLFKGL